MKGKLGVYITWITVTLIALSLVGSVSTSIRNTIMREIANEVNNSELRNFIKFNAPAKSKSEISLDKLKNFSIEKMFNKYGN